MTAESGSVPELTAVPGPPEVPPPAPCARCGTFVVAGQARRFGAHAYCAGCAARPEVNPVEGFRTRYTGRRTLTGYLVPPVALVCALLSAAVALGVHGWGYVIPALCALASLWSFGYFFGWTWARPSLLVLPMIAPVLFVADPANQPMDPVDAGISLLLGALVSASLWFVHRGVRTRLFFRLPVTERELERAWRAHAPNRAARAGLWLMGVGLVLPFIVFLTESSLALPLVVVGLGLALAGLCASVVGLVRVRRNADPPVGGLRDALVGVVGGLSWAVWALAKLAEL